MAAQTSAQTPSQKKTVNAAYDTDRTTTKVPAGQTGGTSQPVKTTSTHPVNSPSTSPVAKSTMLTSTNYQADINKAVEAGNLADAARYEQMRNAKIDALNAAGQNSGNYEKTYKYTAYLPAVAPQSSFKMPEPLVTEDDIKALYAQMQQQSGASIDYTVQQGINELRRAEEDAQKGFQQQRNQTNIEEAQARDAQVLYAAARGDRGGITARQYDSIANTAANNRRAIAEQQQKLATDTARQVADLRAQGEFQKANAVLQIAQQQLAALQELQQYNSQLAVQQQQIAMQEANLTGYYNGQKTYAAQQAEKEWAYQTSQAEKQWAYDVAMQSIQAGIMPSADVLSTAGMSTEMASQMAAIYKASLTAKKSSGSDGNKTPERPSTKDQIYKDAETMWSNGADDTTVWEYLLGASPDETWARTYANFLGIEIPTAITVPVRTPARAQSVQDRITEQMVKEIQTANPDKGVSIDDLTESLKNDPATWNNLGLGPVSPQTMQEYIKKGYVSFYK